LKYGTDSRLLTPKEFRYVFEKPKKIRGEAIDFYVRANNKSHPRLGLAVPKKAIKSAVMRNRMKRLLRERFRKENTPLGGYDVIVMIKPGIIRFPASEYAGVVMQHWQRFIKQCDTCV